MTGILCQSVYDIHASGCTASTRVHIKGCSQLERKRKTKVILTGYT